MPETTGAQLRHARAEALEVRALYERLEEHLNGRTWSTHELMLGFSNDVGRVGRLLLAHDGTWDVDGDVNAELKHKLSESLWWIFVLAERLDIDLDAAYADTMQEIRSNLLVSTARLGI